MGISWFGEEGNGFTLALRIYDKARGKGLGYGFLKGTMDDFMKVKNIKKRKTRNGGWKLQREYSSHKNIRKLGFKYEKDGRIRTNLFTAAALVGFVRKGIKEYIAMER